MNGKYLKGILSGVKEHSLDPCLEDTASMLAIEISDLKRVAPLTWACCGGRESVMAWANEIWCFTQCSTVCKTCSPAF